MARPESIQWQHRRWLGDNTVLQMDWDATAMHFHLLMMSIQEKPPGSIPNDMAAIRRWLRSPSEDTWRRVRPQIFAAWQLREDRWFNTGMVETFERKERFCKRYEKSTRKVRESAEKQENSNSIKESDFDVGSKSKSKPSLKEAEEIYDCYPRKVGKTAALKAISYALTRLMAGEYMTKTLTPTEAFAGLKQRTLTFADSIAGNRGNFTPHPATWFNRSSYLDDPKEWNADEQRTSTPRSVERACSNAAAIQAGLDLGGNAAAVRDDAGSGSHAGGNPALGADVRERIAREIALGIPRTPANLKVLS